MEGLLAYEFMRNALVAGVLASVICGVMGVYVVLKRIVFISGGIAHFSFSGVGFSYLVDINPMLSTILFSLVAALSIGWIKEKIRLDEDSTIGMLWASGMALGIIFVGLSKGYATELISFLFGNILAVSREDLVVMFVLTAIVVVTAVALFKELFILTYDEDYGRVMGLPTYSLNLLLLCLIALTGVVLIKIVGVILVIALLTIPAATSKLLASTIRSIMVLAIGIGLVFTVTGLFLSYYVDLASGATIVIVSTIGFFIVSLLHKVRAKRKRKEYLKTEVST
ncbi:MAG TPA: metal ABC transporter permease [Methanomicrobia archaeon]|nr:metal ABC transporter permease [Methanomicrobia archaeon]